MLNWLLRYAPVVDLVRAPGGGLGGSVLDVGCGPHGLACALPGVAFTGVDVLFPHEVAPGMTAVRSDGGPLPFRDASFATVVCLDVLEHVPAGDRAGLVQEMARVAAERVVVACPVVGAAAIDDHLRGVFARAGVPEPEWLSEHEQHGLPTPEEVAAACADVPGFTARPLPMPNGLLSAMVAVLEITTPFGAAAAAAARDEREQWLSLFGAARFGDGLRGAWVLERDEARTPIVQPGDVPGGTVRALRCPGCAGSLALTDGLPACTACGRRCPQDPEGSWDVTGPGWFCEPSWQPASLQTLLRRFDAEHPVRGSLTLLARPERCDEPTAVRLVLEALDGHDVRDGLDIDIVTAPPADTAHLRVVLA